MRVDRPANGRRSFGCIAAMLVVFLAFAPSAQAGHAPQFRSVATAEARAPEPVASRCWEFDAAPLQVFGGGRTSVTAAVPPQIVKILRRDVSPRGGKGNAGERLVDRHARPAVAALSRSAQAVLIANAAHLPHLCRWLL